MRVFVTGATGFIGTALVPELIGAGHTVVGMTRSDEGAEALKRVGAEAHFGTLEDIESMRRGAADAYGVIHLAFDHDFSKFVETCENDRRVIDAMGDVMKGSNKPFIGTGGVLADNPVVGSAFGEDDVKPVMPFPRVSEEATLANVDKGVKAMVMRLSQIHDRHKQGFITFLIQIAQQKKVVAYVGEGSQRWAAAHRTDTARLYRLALEKGSAGSKWHAVGEQGVTSKAIAEAIGRRLNLPVVSISPEKAPAHFGFLSYFMMLDSPSSNTKTIERLGWHPTGPSLIEDLNNLVL